MDTLELEFLKNNNMTFQSVIAKGGFGTIYLVFSLQYQQFFALKKIPENRFNKAEVDCLMEIDHPNIISLYKYYKFQEYIYLLMEYCPYDLETLLKKESEICEDQLKRYCYGILQGIKACHDRNISHSDIKPSNFLIDKYGRIKVCDFGLSVMHFNCADCHSFRGTIYFMAPEILCKKGYDSIKADIWSLGITFFYMATQTFPFNGDDRKDIIKEVTTGMYPISKVESAALRQVITSCLQIDPLARPTVDDLLNMPFFESIKRNRPHRGNISMAHSLNQLNYKPLIYGCTSRLDRASLNPMHRLITKPRVSDKKQ